jgi:hypothetical protein
MLCNNDSVMDIDRLWYVSKVWLRLLMYNIDKYNDDYGIELW